MGFSNKQELERTNFQLQGGLSGWKSVWLVCKTSIAWHWQMFAETRKRKWKHCRHFGSSNLCQVSYCSLVDQAHLIVTSNGRDILSSHHQTVSTYLMLVQHHCLLDKYLLFFVAYSIKLLYLFILLSKYQLFFAHKIKLLYTCSACLVDLRR